MSFEAQGRSTTHIWRHFEIFWGIQPSLQVPSNSTFFLVFILCPEFPSSFKYLFAIPGPYERRCHTLPGRRCFGKNCDFNDAAGNINSIEKLHCHAQRCSERPLLVSAEQEFLLFKSQIFSYSLVDIEIELFCMILKGTAFKGCGLYVLF